MSIETALKTRANSVCELCSATDDLSVYEVPSSIGTGADAAVLLCGTCKGQIEAPETVDANHWRCLNDSMWSQVPAVQVMAWRMLNRLRGEGWPVDLLDMMYMEPETLTWAKASGDHLSDDEKIIHLDSNGNVLQNGDNVTLTQTLNVKGSSITAKRGTAVRGIRLVPENAEQIEGRVNGQQIVILTKFVKKSS